MELKKNERSILAYFPSSAKAIDAAEALKAKGINDVQVDRVSRYGVASNPEVNNPISGQGVSGTGLSLYSAGANQFGDNDARVLLSADPSVSGMTAKEYGTAGGEAFLVTAVTTKDKVEQAVKILKEKGAKI
ncbi:hypothetical protein [Carboxydothermus hydrogenoformans]|uniref:Uncharacterized protein n=1 Tax=Carboxydothermus hydrogenoformans (strain ATCC BAA-161 / DSM 6008 / Z-2901) TaxID=246194 RepID=Q3ABB3_CARHZ|nr:hypothetical protein [Carboxydothermus hydrogenoformans]ABB14960.1 hypothetical protein CHY_1751 [Carboxydothermus hydrogenoformans Z-2901]